MRVLVWGTYRENYSRNKLIFDGLKKAGVEIIECHETLWKGDEDREKIARGKWISPSFWMRLSYRYIKLIKRFFTHKDFDIIYIAYPGHFDVFIGKLLSIISKRPMVWDVLNSFFLIMKERKIYGNWLEKFSLRLIKQIERKALLLPELLFLDNQIFVNWVCDIHAIDRAKFRLIPIGADSRFFYPNPYEEIDNKKMYILYYGTYIPNHGVNHILDAARILQNDHGIHFIFVGDGPEKYNSQIYVAENKLENITFIKWLNKDELLLQIWKSHIILGVFGDTLQVSLTNNNKIIEAFAVNKPVISGFTQALPQEIKHGVNIHLCKSGDSIEIARSIRYLVGNPNYCKKIAKNGYATYLENFENLQIGKIVLNYLKEVV